MFGAYAADKLLTSLGIEQLCGDERVLRCVAGMYDRTAVTRGDFDGRVEFRGGSSAYDDRCVQSCFFHFGNDVAHLFEGGGDESAQPYEIGLFGNGSLHDFFSRNHHAEVDYLEVVAGENDGDDVFPDVVHIALDCGYNEFSPFRGFSIAGIFLLDEWLQYTHCLLHGAGALDDLGKEHFPVAEKLSHPVHAVHEGLLDDGECRAVLTDGLCEVGFEVCRYAFDESLFQSVGDRLPMTVFVDIVFFFDCFAPMFLGEVDETFGRIRPTVQYDIFDERKSFGR